MRIKLTGIAAELHGGSFVEIPGSGDVSDFKSELIKKIPDLIRYSYLVIINDIKAEDHQKIVKSDKIMILPPFSGG